MYGDKKITLNTKGLWRLDSNGTDSSGLSNTLTDTGSKITYVPGVYSNCAFSNDVVGDSVLQAYIDILGSGMQYSTFSCWAKVTGFAAWDVGYFASFASKATRRGYYLQMDATNRIGIGAFDKTGGGTYDGHWHEGNGAMPSFIDRSKWHMYTWSINNYVCSIYTDGFLAYTYDTTTPNGTVAFPSDATTLMGSNNYGVTSGNLSPYKGYMDDAWLENRAWSAVEIKNYFTQSKGRFAPHLS